MIAPRYDQQVREVLTRINEAIEEVAATSDGLRLPAWLRLAALRRLQLSQDAEVHHFFVLTIGRRPHYYTCTCSLVVDEAEATPCPTTTQSRNPLRHTRDIWTTVRGKSPNFSFVPRRHRRHPASGRTHSPSSRRTARAAAGKRPRSRSPKRRVSATPHSHSTSSSPTSRPEDLR
jgi:hypothetical protein